MNRTGDYFDLLVGCFILPWNGLLKVNVYFWTAIDRLVCLKMVSEGESQFSYCAVKQSFELPY